MQETYAFAKIIIVRICIYFERKTKHCLIYFSCLFKLKCFVVFVNKNKLNENS